MSIEESDKKGVSLERYEAYLKPDGGRALVIGAAIVGGAFVLAGLILSQPLFVVVAMIAFAVSLYNYPLIRARDPHLIISLQGLEVDGLGLIKWKAIKTARFDQTAEHETVTLKLVGKLMDVVQPSDEPVALRNLQVNLWREIEEGDLVINLKSFQVAATELFSIINRFHSHSRSA